MTARLMLRAILLRLDLAFCRWRLRCIEQEREGYENAGVMLGAQYLINTEAQASDLRSRIQRLEQVL